MMTYFLKALLAPLAVVVLALSTAGCKSDGSGDAPNLRHGMDLLDRLQSSFATRDPSAAGLLVGQIDPADPSWRPRGAAPCAGSAIHLSALADAARLDRSRLPVLNRFVTACDAYLQKGDSRAGYNATLMRPGESNRSYDDNGLMCAALLDAYEVSHDPSHLSRATIALQFVLSGTDARMLGPGGIYLSEWDRSAKHTGATALAMIACLRMDRLTGRPDNRATAIQFYRWVNKNLQDTDGLYFDHASADGIDRAKTSRNAALMLRAICLLFDGTRDPAFLDEADRVAHAAQAFWSDGATGGFHDSGSAAHLLAGAFVDLADRDGDSRWRDVARRCADFLARGHVDRNGWHPAKWDASTPPKSTLSIVRLIDQSCCAATFLRVARPPAQP